MAAKQHTGSSSHRAMPTVATRVLAATTEIELHQAYLGGVSLAYIAEVPALPRVLTIAADRDGQAGVIELRLGDSHAFLVNAGELQAALDAATGIRTTAGA